MNDYFGVCPLGGLNNKLVSVDPFNPHGALKPQKTVLLNADLTLTHFDDVWAHACMVRGGICPPVENGNVEGPKIADIDYQMMAIWRCKMQYQWMNGALCRNNCFSILFSKYVFGMRFRPRPPEFHSWTPVVRRPLSLLPLRGEYPAGAQA